MAKRRRKKHRGSRRSSSSLGGVLLFVFGVIALMFVLFSVQPLPDVSGYVELVKAITVLVLVVAGLYVSLKFGTKFYRTAYRLHERDMHKRSIEDQFAFARAERKFYDMDWRVFEEYLGFLYTKLGYRVEVTAGQGDEGIDLRLYKDGKTYVVQAKRFKKDNNVQRSDIQKFVGAMLGYDGGIFITTSDYSIGAREYAATIPRLKLVNGAELEQM